MEAGEHAPSNIAINCDHSGWRELSIGVATCRPALLPDRLEMKMKPSTDAD